MPFLRYLDPEQVRRIRGQMFPPPLPQMPEPESPGSDAEPPRVEAPPEVYGQMYREMLRQPVTPPGRRPDLGEGAFEARGQVYKPSRLEKVLGYVATGLGGFAGGLGGAARVARQYFDSPYERALQQWGLEQQIRGGQRRELQPLAVEEMKERTAGPLRLSQIERNRAQAKKASADRLPTVVDRYVDADGNRVVAWSDGRREVLGPAQEGMTTSVQPTEGGGAVVVRAPRRGEPSATPVVMPPGVKLRKPGRAEDMPAGPSPAAQPVAPGQRNEEFLKKLDGGTAAIVTKIADGKIQLPSGFALRSPYWQRIMTLVSQYDPSFDAINYNSRFRTRQAFTSGTLGVQVNALNTVIGHLEQLSKKAEGLGNTWSRTYNRLGNFLQTETGDPRVTNFRQVAQSVAQELVRVWRGTGGTEEDIKERLRNLDTSNSPDQLHGAVAEIGNLLESKLDALQEQYRQGMGRSDIRMLTPQSDQVLGRLTKKVGLTRERRAAVGTAPMGPMAPGGRPPLSSFERQ